MAFKDLLLALTTYPEPTAVSALDDAVAVSAALGARISAIACEVTFHMPGSPLGKTSGLPCLRHPRRSAVMMRRQAAITISSPASLAASSTALVIRIRGGWLSCEFVVMVIMAATFLCPLTLF